MDDQIFLLREIAQNLTAKHRRYPDRAMAAGASLLACLLIEYAQRGSAPHPDVVDTFIGMAEKILMTSVTIH